MNYQKVYMNHIHSSSLLCQLAQMWRSQLLCDALICTGNVVTKAHRVVLLAACPMLQSMENASIGTELEVRLAADIKQEAVNTFLQYLYEGFMLLTEDNVKHVEKVARLLQVDSVIKCCSDFFKCLEKSTGKLHNGNYKFDKYDLLEFRHVRATGLQKTYHERLMKRISESPRSGSPTGGKRQRMHRPSSPSSDTPRTDDAFSMSQSYMPTGGSGSIRSGTSNQSTRSDSPSVIEIVEDSLELIQREKPLPGQPEPSRLSQQKTSISVASHVSNTKDTRVVSIADDGGGGRTRTTDSFSERVQMPSSSSNQQQSSPMSVSPKLPFRDPHQSPSIHPNVPPSSMVSRIPSQPPPPPLQPAGTLNIAPLTQGFPSRPQEQPSTLSRLSQLSTDVFSEVSKQSFMSSTPQRSHPSFSPSGAKPTFAAGSASQAGHPPQSAAFQIQPSSQAIKDLGSTGMDKTEGRESESSRPQEGHDPGPSGSPEDTADLAIVKIEKVEDDTGGLLMHVDNGQGDGPRHGQYPGDDEQEYDDSDMPADWSQDDMSNLSNLSGDGSMTFGDPSAGGPMFMGPTSDMTLSDDSEDQHKVISNVEDVDESKPHITFECQTCNMKYAHKSSLKRHLIKHSKDPKFDCSICHQYFPTEGRLEEHCLKWHTHRFICETCGKDFKTKSILDNHLVQVHKQEHEKLITYKCPHEGCDMMFSRKQAYQFHLNAHTGVKPYSCKNCSRSFTNLYRQRDHERICEGKVEITCSICHSKFTDRASLRRHDAAAHRGIKHVCECGKQFTQLSSLRRHKLEKDH